jgi:hypothetical protein
MRGCSSDAGLLPPPTSRRWSHARQLRRLEPRPLSAAAPPHRRFQRRCGGGEGISIGAGSSRQACFRRHKVGGEALSTAHSFRRSPSTFPLQIIRKSHAMSGVLNLRTASSAFGGWRFRSRTVKTVAAGERLTSDNDRRHRRRRQIHSVRWAFSTPKMTPMWCRSSLHRCGISGDESWPIQGKREVGRKKMIRRCL